MVRSLVPVPYKNMPVLKKTKKITFLDDTVEVQELVTSGYIFLQKRVW